MQTKTKLVFLGTLALLVSGAVGMASAEAFSNATSPQLWVIGGACGIAVGVVWAALCTLYLYLMGGDDLPEL